MRKLAKNMNMSEKHCQKDFHVTFGMSPFKMKTCQQLTNLQKEKIILLNKLKKGTTTDEIVFSDEKLFTIGAKLNS